MSKNLEEPNKYEVVIKGKTYPAQSKISSIEMMKGAVAGIQSHCANNCLLIAGTHLKEYLNPEQQVKNMEECLGLEQMLKDIDEEIVYKNIVRHKADKLVKKRQKGKNTRYIHPINNLEKSNDRNCIANEIRLAVEGMSKNEDICEEIPINCHLFQLEIQLQIDSTPNKNYITRATCIEYAKQCCIKELPKIDKLLKYFHNLGIMLYYGEIVKDVVFSPQWIFDRLSDIIFLKYSCEGYDCDVKENIKKGIIKKETFNQMYEDKIDVDGALTVDQFLEIFVSQNIIAKYPDNDETFFMPALRNPAPPHIKPKLTDDYGKKIYDTLYVKFDQQYFPRVVFFCLDTHFMKKEWSIQDKYAYSDIMIFQAPGGEHFVGLFDNKTELAVEVYQKEGNSIPITQISGLIFKFLTNFCEKIKISCKFKFGFTCKQTDCKHFAAVNLQYPFSTFKCCEECKMSSKLSSNELVWLISVKEVVKAFNPQVRIRMCI